jgi:hypothetical protein
VQGPYAGPIRRIAVLALVAVALYGLVRLQRNELVDFAVPYTAATRYAAAEQLYRPSDGHYQYKYLPAFALTIVPFTWFSKPVAEFLWFFLTVAMTWAFVQLSLSALPGRRRGERLLIWLTLFFTGKFLVKELAFGQFNLPLGLLLLGAAVAAESGRKAMTGAAIAAGVFVKPYALVMTPWLVWTLGWRPVVVFVLVLITGLLVPAVTDGWDGNVMLLTSWYRTVTDTTAPNLMGHENISFASMWAKWIGPGPPAAGMALVTAILAMAGGVAVMWRRKQVAQPNFLECAYFSLLVPLLSPQGWDYVLILGLPGYMLLIDRWHDLSLPWRVAAGLGIFLTSFTIFDLLRRPLYIFVMEQAGVSVGALLMAACLIRLRWRASA